MNERDVDIDFDFFEEEPPTEESSRTQQVVRRRGPGGPRRPPSTPQNLTPLLRLVGLIAFAILIIVLLVFWIQSCQESGKKASYRNYMDKVSQVASSSQQIGRQLSQLLTIPGTNQATVERRISNLARQEQLNVDRAREITPPGRLVDENQAVIQALQFRTSGLIGLGNAIARTAKTKDLTQAGGVLATQMQRFLASDVVFDDAFKDPAQAELRRQGVTGTNASGGPLVPDSKFLQSSEFVTASAMVPVLQRLRGGSVTVPQGGIRGTNIASTKVLPSGKELTTSETNTVTVTADIAYQVIVKNSGDATELSIPVKLIIEQAGAQTINRTAKINIIDSGQEKAVTFRNLPAPKFGAQATLKIEVTPVPTEHNTTNNSASYPVIFGVP